MKNNIELFKKYSTINDNLLEVDLSANLFQDSYKNIRQILSKEYIYNKISYPAVYFDSIANPERF